MVALPVAGGGEPPRRGAVVEGEVEEPAHLVDLGVAGQLHQALDAATAVRRPSEVARAHALLACIAARRGALDTALQHAPADTRDQLPRHVRVLCAEAETLTAHNPEEDTWQ